jgi:hypothetical protein
MKDAVNKFSGDYLKNRDQPSNQNRELFDN